MCVACLLIVFVAAFIGVASKALILAIFVRVFLSWVPTLRLPFGLGDLAWSVSEPILAPIRRVIPIAAGIDFSPLVALILIQFVANLLLGLLPPAV